MFEGLSFGWRTAVLTVAVMQMLILALALVRSIHNRPANRTLAALLLTMAFLVLPWLIGFAGFYDRWMWLTFAPFQLTLAVTPLAWLYVIALTEGHVRRDSWRHLTPAAAQALYLTACFALPFRTKMAWAEQSALTYGLITGAILIAQMIGYGAASARQLASYRAALADHVANTHRYAARWLSSAIAALALLFLVWTGYLLWDAFAPLGYRGLMGLYLAIAVAALFLGIEGWRHAALPFPHLGELVTDPVTDSRDWAAQGRAWAAIVREQRWSRDPDLTLARLARHLGTNASYLSRAINQGEQTNFATFIAKLRAEAVAARLSAGDKGDLLTIALEEGFGSKASFNRAFVSVLGQSPSAYRRAVANHE
jgi:AraC-like DNA-binding protein